MVFLQMGEYSWGENSRAPGSHLNPIKAAQPTTVNKIAQKNFFFDKKTVSAPAHYGQYYQRPLQYSCISNISQNENLLRGQLQTQE